MLKSRIPAAFNWWLKVCLSKFSLKILNLIEDNPGINSVMISRKLNLRTSSVKYDIDKLVKLDFVILEKINREIELYIKKVNYK